MLIKLLFASSSRGSPTGDGGLDELKRVLSSLPRGPPIHTSQVLIGRIVQVCVSPTMNSPPFIKLLFASSSRGSPTGDGGLDELKRVLKTS